MATLREALDHVRTRIERYRGLPINEQNTKASLIEPILRVLGWDTEDFEEVHREYKPKSADKPVDYALFLMRSPRAFIEAKALGQDLDDRRWANQIMGYASVAGVEWIILTDGNEYRIYNSHAAVPVEEKLFRRVYISDESMETESTLSLLSKESIQKDEIGTLWQAYFVDWRVRTVIQNLFGPEPDSSLVRLIGERVRNLSENDIVASLHRAHIRFDFPLELPPLHDSRTLQTVGQSITEPKKFPVNDGMQPERLLMTLIEAGLIEPPLQLGKIYKGRRMIAQVESDGKVTFNGESFNSLSMAGKAARSSVIGEGKPANTNGWSFWKFKDVDGQMKEIDILRQRYLKQE